MAEDLRRRIEALSQVAEVESATRGPHEAMKTAIVATVLALSVLVGCKEELCIGSPPPRCEGNVRSYCPGGFGTLDMTREREDCRAVAQYCGTFEEPDSPIASCMPSAGTCTSDPLPARCEPDAPGAPSGNLLRCQNGQLLAVGPRCDVAVTRDAG